MIGSVNLYNINHPFKIKTDAQNFTVSNQPSKSVPFGYRDDYQNHPVRDLFFTLTDDIVGLTGLNAALWYIQSFVNGKILSGKINKHFTSKITEEQKNKFPSMAYEMLEEKGLKDKVKLFQGKPDEAFFTHQGNFIKVGKDQYSALFHEIGHAVEENNTVILKKLQRFRGKYTILSLALYALLSQRQKNDDGNQSILSKSDALIPLIAFSPELITEAKASQIGLKFLKEKLNAGVIEKSLYKNIKKSYITCFATYLFIPVSIMLMDALRNGANKARQRKIQRQNPFYY